LILGPIAQAVLATHVVQAVGAVAYIAVPVLAPAIARDLGIDSVLVGAYVSLMWGAAMLSSAWSGRLLARLGAFTLSRLTMIVCGLGIAAAASDGMFGLVIAAILIGLGCGPETPASSAILGRLVPLSRQPFLFSLKQTGVQAGAFSAGLVLPLLEAGFGWRAALLAVAALNVAAALLMRPLDRVFDDGRRPPEPPGGVGLRQGLLLVFASRPILILSLAAFAFSTIQISLNGYLVTYGVAEAGYDLATAALLLAIAQLGGFIGRPLWGYVSGRILPTRALMACLGLGMAGAGLIVGLYGAALPFAALSVIAFVFGLTASGWNGVYIAEIARLAPAGQIGLVSGAAFAFGFTGLVVGPLVYGWIAKAANYGTGYIALAIFCLLAVAMLARRG